VTTWSILDLLLEWHDVWQEQDQEQCGTVHFAAQHKISRPARHVLTLSAAAINIVTHLD
jgi:hypothetical protein